MSEMNGRKIAIWRCILTFWASAPGAVAAGSVIREATSWTSDEMIARKLSPEKSAPGVPRKTSGTPQLTPKAVGLRHGFRTVLFGPKMGTVSQLRLRIVKPKTSIIGWMLKFWRPGLKTEESGIRRNIWRTIGRQPGGGDPRALSSG